MFSSNFTEGSTTPPHKQYPLIIIDLFNQPITRIPQGEEESLLPTIPTLLSTLCRNIKLINKSPFYTIIIWSDIYHVGEIETVLKHEHLEVAQLFWIDQGKKLSKEKNYQVATIGYYTQSPLVQHLFKEHLPPPYIFPQDPLLRDESGQIITLYQRPKALLTTIITTFSSPKDWILSIWEGNNQSFFDFQILVSINLSLPFLYSLQL